MRHVLGHQDGFHLPVAISKTPEVEALDFSSQRVNGGIGVGRRFRTNRWIRMDFWCNQQVSNGRSRLDRRVGRNHFSFQRQSAGVRRVLHRVVFVGGPFKGGQDEGQGRDETEFDASSGSGVFFHGEGFVIPTLTPSHVLLIRGDHLEPLSVDVEDLDVFIGLQVAAQLGDVNVH